MKYSEKTSLKVARIFGKDSDIYYAMLNGKMISPMICKLSHKRGDRNYTFRDKRILLEECRKEELENLNKTSDTMTL